MSTQTHANTDETEPQLLLFLYYESRQNNTIYKHTVYDISFLVFVYGFKHGGKATVLLVISSKTWKKYYIIKLILDA